MSIAVSRSGLPSTVTSNVSKLTFARPNSYTSPSRFDSRGSGYRARAHEQVPHAAQQLVQVERLLQVLVGADVEARGCGLRSACGR